MKFSIAALLIISTANTITIKAQANDDNKKSIVLILHGMGRTSLSMNPMESFLESKGYQTDNWNYDGFFSTTKELGIAVSKRISSYESDETVKEVVAVTHSLGGIILRTALQNPLSTKLKTVVMLAPPNQGSSSADRFAPLLSWFLRPIADLVTGDSSFIASLNKISGKIKVGIISGDSDPLVSHKEAYLEEATEHTRVKASHTFIMRKDRVQQLTLCFLKFETFEMCPE